MIRDRPRPDRRGGAAGGPAVPRHRRNVEAAGWPDRLGADFAGRFVLAPGEASKTLATVERAARRDARGRDRPGGPCRRGRRRRGRRRGGFRRGVAEARLRLGRGADQPARPGRCRDRRQDRGECAPGQESDRRLPRAGPGADRSGGARHPARARAARRLCRGREIRPDRRTRFLRLVRGERRGLLAGDRGGAAARDRNLRARQDGAWSRATSAN